MKNSTKKDNKESLIYTCTYTIIGGALISAMYTPWAIAGNLLISGGFMAMAYSAVNWTPFDRLFRNLGLGIDGAYPFPKGKEKTDCSTIYRFTLPCGLCLKDFDDNKDAIEQHLGRDIEIKYTYKEIQIEVFKDKMKTLYDYEPFAIDGDVPVIIGYDRKGNLVSCDLANVEPHMLIAGETGGGKSTSLRSIITNFILKSKVKLHLVDLKNGAEFNLFQKSSHVETFCRNIKETENLLMNLSIEVDRRYDLFYENDVKDIKEYNKKFKHKKLDYQVLIIDEFADLQGNKNCMAILEELGRKARACGIHLILSTQRPDHKVLTGPIKANISVILGLKTLNSTNSQIIINEPGLEKLRGQGHGIFKRGNKVEIQAPYLDTDKARDLIKHTFVERKAKTESTEIKNFDFLEVL
ncbi:MAG: FtsK/SpoIIIE domain-containing protein [Anaerocolumna aminovalerica]|uniref:FtsK/SpoIIIE domain-containing protein n=1 Tax=Anaerocolumna aminovalerica TaxID=1527 RepID=UPI002913293D|nr:FtsK/SpoIIIE domain-containing protein [Anaerocolumna aminovalerica]MDU6263738.1 FtsK/SpoIIIE domain-containing protein [Anaerocolumna aminovalerica]